MNDEKDYRQMTATELRAAISDYNAQQQGTAQDPVPLPPAANRAALTPEQQEKLFDNWIQDINTRPSNTWTREEVAAYRVATVRALRTLGAQ